jgi:hypothetical protein
MNMKIKSFLFALILGYSATSNGQSITFSEHIAPIIYNQCTNCHRPGEIGPFSLTNYTEVAAYGSMIQYVTDINYMPPWKPDPNYRQYQKENYLSAEQKQQISTWVNDGMPQGNPALEPPLPVFPTGSQVGVPDLVLSFAEAHTVQGNNIDEYIYFVIPTGLTEDKLIRSLEFRPGNTQVVHHTLIWEDTTGGAAAQDALTPEYGYFGGQATAEVLEQQQLPGYLPGSAPVIYTNGITQKLHAGADLKLQMHYAPTPIEQTDSSTINIFFENSNADRLLQTYIMVPLPGVLVNGPFIMPPNQIKEFHGTFNVPFDVSLFSISPHCHKLGTHWKVYAVPPTGDTIPLISIEDWDFNWQGSYQFRSLLKVPAGSVIHAFAGYDNTVNNPFNPNSPPEFVSWGEGTADEMFYLPISFLPYQQGDENIVFEDGTVGNLNIKTVADKLYPIYPVPASDIVKFGYTLETAGNVSLSIFNIEGKLIQSVHQNSFHLPGYHTKELKVSDLTPGIYFLEFTKGNLRQTEKFVIGE